MNRRSSDHRDIVRQDLMNPSRPSQAEGERRDDRMKKNPDELQMNPPKPSQAEGERRDD